MKVIRVRCFSVSTAVLIALSGAALTQADEKSTEQKRVETIRKGIEYLRKKGQAADGTFSSRAGPGLTSLAVTAALRNGLQTDDPMVAKGLKALEGFVKPDGGIYGNGRLRNYETCVAMICFAEANKNGKYDQILKRAKAFVTEIQYGTAGDRSDVWNGGSGYAGAGRPDLSNTAYVIEALRAVDAPADDPAIQRALAFVSRCQNLKSKHNDTKFAGLVNDGGLYYEIPKTKVDPSTSTERFTENGGLRSYGSMTYAGLKSMIYAGLTPTDPRVKAANTWIAKNYDVKKNPGMGSAGLFYYYHLFAASLNIANVDQLTDADGKKHDWRADLVDELTRRQAEDGSWANENQRWFENDKNLSTSFALMALAYCEPAPKNAKK